jgi:ankyrin repeat protein/O-glycosyl hydrolase/predicted glycoside hydrolase/deacetylase ChbG (UPF0249 family)
MDNFMMKRNRIFGFCQCVVLLLRLASVCAAQQAPTPASSSVEVKVDTQVTHQTIQGFGTMWIESRDRPEYHDPAFFDMAADDLGLSILRIFAPTDLEPVNDDNDPNHFNWPAFKTATMNDRMTFAQQFKKRGVQRFLLTVLSPSEFLKTNRSADWGGALRADMYDEYAEQVAAMVILAQKNWGINITDVTIQNELLFTEFYGSCVYYPEGAREAVRALMHKFQKEGIKTRIFMPEDMMVYDRMMAYIKPTMADPETSKFPGGFCTHRLGGYDEVRRWYESTKKYGRENWMTETGGHPQTWTGAMNMAGDMYDYLVGGNFNAWIYERLTGDAGAVSALFADGKPAPKYYAAKHYFRYVRPGAVRIEAQSPDVDLLVSAYRHDVDGTLTVVLINRSDRPMAVQLAMSGRGLPQTYSVYRSTETDQCAEQPQAAAAPKLDMPPKSIVTLYGKSDSMKTRQALDPIPIAWIDPKLSQADKTERWGDPTPVVTPPFLIAAGWQRHPGDPDRIRQMVSAGTSVNSTDLRGWTALHMAILCGNQGNAIPTLLELGANVNQATKDGWTPLHAAAASFHDNRYPVFRLIMDAKPDVNAKTLDGLTPLHVAVASAYVGYQQTEEDVVNRVRDLIKAGAVLEAQDINGRTPLHWAAMQGAMIDMSISDFIVRALLEAGANANAVDKLGRTPLHYAAEQGFDPIVAALRQAGAKIGAKDNQGKTPADLATPRALTATLDLLKVGLHAGTSAVPKMAAPAATVRGTGVLGAELIRATRSGNVKEVQSLLARGADDTFMDSDGFRAVDRARNIGNAEILKMLLEAEKKLPKSATTPPRLIVRGDDMGFSHSCNEAVIKCYREGIMTSVEVLTPSPWFPEAVKLLAENPRLDVGVHLTLTSEWEGIKWRPISHCPSLVDADGYLNPMVLPNKHYPGRSLSEQNWNIDDIEREFRAQIEMAKRHFPSLSHISSHMGCATMNGAIAALTRRLAREYNLGYEMRNVGLEDATYVGPKSTSDEKKTSFLRMLESLEPGKTYVFVDHPGIDGPELRAIYHIGYEDVGIDRQGVTNMWTDPAIKAAVLRLHIELVSYGQLMLSQSETSSTSETLTLPLAR